MMPKRLNKAFMSSPLMYFVMKSARLLAPLTLLILPSPVHLVLHTQCSRCLIFKILPAHGLFLVSLHPAQSESEPLSKTSLALCNMQSKAILLRFQTLKVSFVYKNYSNTSCLPLRLRASQDVVPSCVLNFCDDFVFPVLE